MMMKDKSVLILQNTNAEPKFLRYAGFSFRNPFGMFFEE